MTDRARLETAVVDGIARTSTPMQWAVDDCTMWIADILRDALGYDICTFFRGKYHSQRGAARLMAANGGLDGIFKAIARRHKWEPIEPSWGRPGDVGLVWTFSDTGAPVLAACICRARGWFVGRNDCGFTVVPAHGVAVAWSVLPVAYGHHVNLARVPIGPLQSRDAVVHAPLVILGIEAILGVAALSAGATALITAGVDLALGIGASKSGAIL